MDTNIELETIDPTNVIEHKITPQELQEIFNDMTIEELYDELPLKNIYKDFDNFEKELNKTHGNTLLEKFCTLTILKCRERIDYLQDKRDSLEICDCDNFVDELDKIIEMEKDALNYFEVLFIGEKN